MEGQRDDRRNSYSSYWSKDTDSDSYTDSYSGSYPDSYSYSGSYLDSDSYSDVYFKDFKEEDSSTSKGTEFPDKMEEEVSENNPQKASNVAVTVALPLAAAVFALLVVVGLVLRWKETLKCEGSKQVSKSSHNNAIMQDTVEGTTIPREHHFIELSVSSLKHHFSGGNGKVEEGAIAKGKASVEADEYAEIDEYAHQMYQTTIFKVDNHQPGSEYMDLGSNSANASVYEKLNHQRRRYEVDNIGSNDIKDIQPQ
ncbi:hypothetical protein HOLleu_20026 [Holothuria leucospilota]|uniref:Uncharacterized protein n=1 Tax=Holothuria leucospilota TaxID=206669 RepID=A0A9Q1C166_HOLLE|nr:hypothetical protein HOLleu_20026 [Holothuria leucospilota]